MQARASYVEKKMHNLVTTPWASVHPVKLERDERRDEALVKQAERQVRADEKMLTDAKAVSEHDKKLLTVAVARKSLQIDTNTDPQERRHAAMEHLSSKHHKAHSAFVHPVPLLPPPSPHTHTHQSFEMSSCTLDIEMCVRSSGADRSVHQGLHALSHLFKGSSGRSTRTASSAAGRWRNMRVPPPIDYADSAKGPSSSAHRSSSSTLHRGGWNVDAARTSSTRAAASPQSMSARFEAVRHKSASLTHLGDKHSHIYANAASKKAHDTVESLPYLLPPIGLVTLLLICGGTYSVKRWQRIPSGYLSPTPLACRSFFARACVRGACCVCLVLHFGRRRL